MSNAKRYYETGLDLFHRVIVHGGSALDPATFIPQRRSYLLSLATRLNCSVDDTASTPSQQPGRRHRLVDCLKRSPVADLVAASAAISAEAPRFLVAFGPSVDGRTVQSADLRSRMSDRGDVDDRHQSEFANVSLLVGISVGDGLSRLTLTELDAGSGDVELNRKRRTLVRTFVQNLLTFHRQTIADIFLHQVRPSGFFLRFLIFS